MKKILSIALVFVLIFAFSSCAKTEEPSGKPGAETIKINVFAAASMTETLNAIKAVYEEENKGVELIYTLDSSGTLKTQIEEGAACDLFISAAQKQMNALEEGGMVSAGTRIDLLENKCVLAAATGNPAGIEGYEDLASDKLSLIALGNSDVPVGQYSEEILTNMGIWDQLNSGSKITFGSNVKEVTAQISSGAADCGIVYGTDAAAAGLEVIAEAPAGSHKPVVYPAAVMAGAENPEAAQAFLDYLQTETCREIFVNAGFSMAK